MDPEPERLIDIDELARQAGRRLEELGVAQANGQVATAAYVWRDAEGAYLPFALNVLSFEGERIKEVTSFLNRVLKGTDPDYYARFPDRDVDPDFNHAYFERFGLPAQLD